MVQKYINDKNKPINLGPKGLTKIELKKKLCKITNSAQIEAQAQTRQTDQSDPINWWPEPPGLSHISGRLRVVILVTRFRRVESGSGPNPTWPDSWTALDWISEIWWCICVLGVGPLVLSRELSNQTVNSENILKRFLFSNFPFLIYSFLFSTDFLIFGN